MKIQLIIVKRKEEMVRTVSALNPPIRLFAGQNSMNEKEFWHEATNRKLLDFDLPAVSSSEIRRGKSATQWIVPSTRLILQSALRLMLIEKDELRKRMR